MENCTLLQAFSYRLGIDLDGGMDTTLLDDKYVGMQLPAFLFWVLSYKKSSQHRQSI